MQRDIIESAPTISFSNSRMIPWSLSDANSAVVYILRFAVPPCATKNRHKAPFVRAPVNESRLLRKSARRISIKQKDTSVNLRYSQASQNLNCNLSLRPVHLRQAFRLQDSAQCLTWI